MKQSCTIYAKTKNYSTIASIWGKIDLSRVDFELIDTAPDEINLKTPDGHLKLSLKKQVMRGDDFSRIILGTYNFVQNIETDHSEVKKNLEKFLLESEAAVGIVAEPEFTETDERLDIVFSIAELLDGVIFNGAEMIDKTGKLILDNAGSTEIAFV